MIVNIHAAKTNLSKLIAHAEAGEEVIIARAGKPSVRLAPVASPPPRKGSWLDSLKGQVSAPPGLLETDEELLAEFEASEIFPRPGFDR